MGEALARARILLRPVLDFALPPRCPGCGAIIGEPHRFCPACWNRLLFLGEPCCTCCGLPFAYEQAGGGEARCGACLAEPPAFDRMRAAVAYGEVPRQVALKLKYGGRPGVAETIARFLERHVEPSTESVLVPVPLHRWRIWKRGYNQAALIAAALGRRRGIEARLDLLDRTRPTPPLRGMNRRERAEAVRGAFRVAPRHQDRVRGRHIVLVDDVFTSGATAGACARVLKRAGAARVDLLCWARVVREETADSGRE
ncbi:ComF family protein [Sphingosinicella terrae]|uniref:ComF family protein n=1 Tax=Sphingosinicella terrae TaxID=2172047 RepID=UPI000E0CC4B1|nr:ComF family protein [Sphingosinicella terrae]